MHDDDDNVCSLDRLSEWALHCLEDTGTGRSSSESEEESIHLLHLHHHSLPTDSLLNCIAYLISWLENLKWTRTKIDQVLASPRPARCCRSTRCPWWPPSARSWSPTRWTSSRRGSRSRARPRRRSGGSTAAPWPPWRAWRGRRARRGCGRASPRASRATSSTPGSG